MTDDNEMPYDMDTLLTGLNLLLLGMGEEKVSQVVVAIARYVQQLRGVAEKGKADSDMMSEYKRRSDAMLHSILYDDKPEITLSREEQDLVLAQCFDIEPDEYEYLGGVPWEYIQMSRRYIPALINRVRELESRVKMYGEEAEKYDRIRRVVDPDGYL